MTLRCKLRGHSPEALAKEKAVLLLYGELTAVMKAENSPNKKAFNGRPAWIRTRDHRGISSEL